MWSMHHMKEGNWYATQEKVGGTVFSLKKNPKKPPQTPLMCSQMTVICFGIQWYTQQMRGKGTDPGSKGICGCGVFLCRSDSRGNRYRWLVQSYRCTAARRVKQHTRPHLQRQWKEANGTRTEHVIVRIVVWKSTLSSPVRTTKVQHPQLLPDQ